MKSYQRLDKNRPYTFNELSQKIPFFKKKDWKKLLEKAVQQTPSLKEQAMYMNKVTDFYSPLVIAIMATMNPEFKKAKEKYEEDKTQNNVESKLVRALKL